MNYELFECQVDQYIAKVMFNRPDKANALPEKGWQELKAIFDEMSHREDVRVVILHSSGKHFCAGIDLSLLMSFQQKFVLNCEGRKREQFLHTVRELQDCVNAIERCRKPVIAAIQGGCIGGGVDIVSACDMRYCQAEAYFSIREIDMGMVADLGTLQRLPKLIPFGVAAEMAYTGRKVGGEEAVRIGLVNRTYPSEGAMMEEVEKIAATIAAKSPLSIRGTKEVLQYARDHSVAEGLQQIQLWNAAMFLSNDLMEAFQSKMEQRKPSFED
ncbi:MAG: crotonase/enoyl-CoA hydratase family protein [Bacteroidota bacterium]